jgi:hypothetical protein
MACTGTHGRAAQVTSGRVHALVGCYQAVTEGWLPGQEQSIWYFALDTGPPEDPRPNTDAQTPSAMWAKASNQRSHASFWRLTRRGIQLEIGDGFQGREVELAPRGDLLVGRSFTFSGNFKGMEAKTTARRVPCTDDLHRSDG